MRRIIPNLWFDSEAEQAAKFYVSVFPDSRITSTSRYPEGAPGPVGTVMTVEFEVNGQRFVGINGGPQFPFTEAVSFQITCETAGRARPLLGPAARRRAGEPVRLAQGQVRPVLAGRPGGDGGAVRRS